VGERIGSLQFKLTESNCNGSKNTQDENSICEDSDLFVASFLDKPIDILCLNESNGEIIFSETSFIGETIKLKNSNGWLPEKMTCKTMTEQEHEIQKVTFDTSGGIDLFLKNTFGMFELDSCEIENGQVQQCIMPIQYKYTVTNNGNTEMEVTNMERRRNNRSNYIIDQVQQASLHPGENPPGDSTPVIERDVVDLCKSQLHETTVLVESEAKPQGVPCFDLDLYKLEFTGFGYADIDISCQSEDGLDCNELEKKVSDCMTIILYSIDVHNYGSTNLSIMKMEILQNGNSLNLETFFEDRDVAPGETTSVDYKDHLNLCIAGKYETTATIKAKSPETGIVEGSETYSFENDFTPFPTRLPTTNPTKIESLSPSEEPTSRPTLQESGTPTMKPSEKVSSTPSKESSSTPSLGPSFQPSTAAPSLTPSLIPSTKPSMYPSIVPSFQPSTAAPSLTPSLIPSTKPSMYPSIVPSFQPSTVAPSLTPSLIPSTKPSMYPSIVPSTAPSSTPTDQCQLGFNLDCKAPSGVSLDGSCNFEYTQPPGCQEKPTEMILRYNGGDCDTSFNLQGNTFFSCEDFNQGPPTNEGAVSYIEVTDFGGNGNIYHGGLVNVGEDFTISGAFGANLNITIFDPKAFTDINVITQAENIIETITFHVTCPTISQNLFLKDRFGAIQLVEFQNALQGRVSVFQTLMLSFEVSSDVAVELQTMDIVANIDNDHFGIYNITDLAVGKVVSPGKSFSGIQSISIDLGRHSKYTAEGVVFAIALAGHKCYGSDNTDFAAGEKLPLLPTTAPTPAPSTSAYPSQDPLTAMCELDASITCKRLDGGSCENLKAPTDDRCVGGSATELSFIYLPSSLCKGSNSQARFICEDFNPETTRQFRAYVKIYRGADTFYAGVVSSGQVFQLSIPDLTNEIQISISTVSASGGVGTLLQTSEMSVACRQEDALALLKTFGHLQLTGFKNPEMGSQQVYADLELTYVVMNDDRRLDALLTWALTDSPFAGVGDEVVSTNDPKRPMGPGDTEKFLETITLNLAAAIGKRFDIFFEIKGEGFFSGKACLDIAELSLQVQ
jgi:hypothetical protein